MNEESEKKQSLEGVIIITPRYSPGAPPKNYNKKKAMSIFCCLHYSSGFRCPELVRASITKAEDVYIIPYPITEHGVKDLHLSHHSSGEFHWTDDGVHVYPLYGEADFPAALGMWLEFKGPPCLCFRKGRGLDDKEVRSILECLTQYLPFTFDVEEAAQKLKDARFYRLVLPEFKKRESNRGETPLSSNSPFPLKERGIKGVM